jgi:hypothetical protein
MHPGTPAWIGSVAVLVRDQHSVHLVLEPDALLLHVLDGEIVDRQVFFFEALDLSGQLMVLIIQVAELLARGFQRVNM